MPYTISSKFFTTSADKISGYAKVFSFPWFIHDSESQEDILQQYINHLYDSCQKHLNLLKGSNVSLSETEEKKLRDTLESLIHAKKVWHETRIDKK